MGILSAPRRPSPIQTGAPSVVITPVKLTETSHQDAKSSTSTGLDDGRMVFQNLLG